MYLSISSSLSPAHQVSQSVEPCLRREIFLALLLLTAATASFAHADEGHAFDITTPANAPRKVLNGESNGLLASAAGEAVSVLKSAVETIESALNLNAPALGTSNGVKKLSGLDNFKRAISSGDKMIVYFWATWCPPCEDMTPIFEGFSDLPQYDTVAFYTVSLKYESDIAAYVGVNPRILPLFVAYKDGQKIGEVTGANIPGMESLLWKLERT